MFFVVSRGVKVSGRHVWLEAGGRVSAWHGMSLPAHRYAVRRNAVARCRHPVNGLYQCNTRKGNNIHPIEHPDQSRQSWIQLGFRPYTLGSSCRLVWPDGRDHGNRPKGTVMGRKPVMPPVDARCRKMCPRPTFQPGTVIGHVIVAGVHGWARRAGGGRGDTMCCACTNFIAAVSWRRCLHTILASNLRI